MILPAADLQEVLPRLWLGSAGAARPALEADFAVLCVLESPSIADEWHIPILVPTDGVAHPFKHPCAYVDQLEEARVWILDHWSARGCDVLVHCAAGIERSPLTLAWFLVQECDIDLDRAYAWLKARRPLVEDRRAWLESMPMP